MENQKEPHNFIIIMTSICMSIVFIIISQIIIVSQPKNCHDVNFEIKDQIRRKNNLNFVVENKGIAPIYFSINKEQKSFEVKQSSQQKINYVIKTNKVVVTPYFEKNSKKKYCIAKQKRVI